MLKDPEKDLLAQVIGIPGASCHPEGQAKNRSFVRIDKMGKGLAVPRQDPPDDLAFVDLLHIQIGPGKSHIILCIFRDKNGQPTSLLDDNHERRKLFISELSLDFSCRPL